jgi:formylglycine-generating enzyme required for sulfatase activity
MLFSRCEGAARSGAYCCVDSGETAELLTHYGWYNINWYNGNSPEQTQPVGTKKPNDWGLFDMLARFEDRFSR